MYVNQDIENSMVMTRLMTLWMRTLALTTCDIQQLQELCDNINQMYYDLGNQSQVYELILKLGEIRRRDDNVTKYFIL